MSYFRKSEGRSRPASPAKSLEVEEEKSAIRAFWNAAPCGEVYAQGGTDLEKYSALSRARYQLEPYVHPFARFAEGNSPRAEARRHRPRDAVQQAFPDGYMLWTRYALLEGKPWRRLRDIYSAHLESPGTQAFTESELRQMFRRFGGGVSTEVQLNFGALLEGEVGQRHRGPLLSVAKTLWPRRLIRRRLGPYGLMLMIQARKD